MEFLRSFLNPQTSFPGETSVVDLSSQVSANVATQQIFVMVDMRILSRSLLWSTGTFFYAFARTVVNFWFILCQGSSVPNNEID